MKISESSLETKVGKWAKAQGCKFYKFSSPANRGVPDRIILLPNGKVIFMEFKAPGKKPTKLQEYHLDEIKKNRGISIWVNSFDQAKQFILNEI